MASVKVKFRESTVEGHAGKLYYQIIHQRRTRQIGTNYSIYPSEWDEGEGMVTSDGKRNRRSYIEGVKDGIRQDVERLARIIRQLEHEGEYTSEDIAEEFHRKTEGGLFGYMEGLIAGLKVNGRIRTSETYRSALSSFRKFRDGQDISLDCLTRKTVEAYEGWLKRGGKSMNTVSFYMRILRAVYRRGIDDGLTEDRRIFSKVYTGVEKTEKRAIPIKTIRRIMTMDFTGRPDLEYARDMFVLSFMLRGMSFVDMANLKRTSLRNGILSYRRKKTSQLLTIRWTEEMQRIVDRHQAKGSQYLLPIIKNQEAITFYAIRNAGYKINKGLKEIGEKVGVGIPLTMYVARHSWATAAKAKGVPTGVISEGLGHDSERTTQIYLASLDGRAIDRVNGMLLKELVSQTHNASLCVPYVAHD